MLNLKSNYKISSHFKYYEVIKSEYAIRNDIDNKLTTKKQLDNAVELGKNVLDKIREHYGSYSPNSWFRCEQLEKSLCNTAYIKWCEKHKYKVDADSWNLYFSKKSHPSAQAADIEITGIDNLDLYNWIDKNLEYDQLILEFYKPGDPSSGWVHVSYNVDGNRKQKFTIG